MRLSFAIAASFIGLARGGEEACSADAGEASCSAPADSANDPPCLDRPKWVDSHGYTCSDYVDGAFCAANGDLGSGWDKAWGSSLADYTNFDGIDASRACCGCGGGLKMTAAARAKPRAKPRRTQGDSNPKPSGGGGGTGGGAVVELDESTFSDYLANTPTAVVMFYAPWCGACKNFKPTYEATSLTGVAEGVGFAKVDATANSKLQRKYKISSYPTVNIYRNGDDTPAHTKLSQRTQPALKAFVHAVHTGAPLPKQEKGSGKTPRKPKTDPKTKPLIYTDNEPSASKVQAFDAQGLRDAIRGNPDKLYVVKLYAEWCSHCKQVHAQFSQASVKVHKEVGDAVVLAKVNIYDVTGVNDMVPNYYGIKTTPSFVMFKDGDPDTMYNFDLMGDQRNSGDISKLAIKLSKGEVEFPEKQARYCVEKDSPQGEICFFEMPCSKQSWASFTKIFREKGWGSSALYISGQAEFDKAIQAKDHSWVLFADENKCGATITLRTALELTSTRDGAVDSLDEETAAKWNIVVVNVNDPLNKAIVEKYVKTPREEGQSIRVISKADPDNALDMDRLMYPILPSLPDYSHDLYILGMGMIKTIWTIRLNGALFEHWGSETLQADLDKVIEEQWDEFLGDGKREMVAEDFVEWKANFRKYAPAEGR